MNSEDDNYHNNNLIVCPFILSKIIDFPKLFFYKHIMNGWISLVVILIGMLANTIAIVVFFQPRMRQSSTNLYLLSLSVSNWMSLLCLLLTEALRWLLVHPYFDVFCVHWYEKLLNLSLPYMAPLNNFFQLCGIYFIVSASVDRLCMVLQSAQINEAKMKKRRADSFTIIIGIVCFCFLFTIPNWFYFRSIIVDLSHDDEHEYTVNNVTTSSILNYNYSTILIPVTTASSIAMDLDEIASERNNQWMPPPKILYYSVEHTDFGRDRLVLKIENIFRYIPFVFAIPILVLSVVNVMIIFELFKITLRRRTRLGLTNVCINSRITVMLVCMIVLFLVSQVPLAILHILYAYNSQFRFNEFIFIFQLFINILSSIYSSANFVLFVCFDRSFRLTIQLALMPRSRSTSSTRARSRKERSRYRHTTCIHRLPTIYENSNVQNQLMTESIT